MSVFCDELAGRFYYSISQVLAKLKELIMYKICGTPVNLCNMFVE
jgi:hypothetical protein